MIKYPCSHLHPLLPQKAVICSSASTITSLLGICCNIFKVTCFCRVISAWASRHSRDWWYLPRTGVCDGWWTPWWVWADPGSSTETESGPEPQPGYERTSCSPERTFGLWGGNITTYNQQHFLTGFNCNIIFVSTQDKKKFGSAFWPLQVEVSKQGI